MELKRLFHRIARRGKKTFLHEQCKDTEENIRIGKTRDLFKKTGDIKGILKQGWAQKKDRNNEDLTEAEAIKKRWQECTELYKKS